MGPAISVVISTFNRAASLTAAIERLARQQTDVPFDVIVVDNNSTDDTPAVVRAAAERFAHVPIRYGFEPRQGVSYGRNHGIGRSAAPIVAFTDDDVVVGDRWVQTIADTMAEHPEVDCVGGPVKPRWSAPPPPWLTAHHWGPIAVVDYGAEPIYIDANRPLCLLTANVAYRREALDRVGHFSPEFPRCQDNELLLRLWGHGGRCLYVPSLVVETDVPESRMTWTYHRVWHTQHGYYRARMRDEYGSRGRTTAALTLFGTPPAYYRELLGAMVGIVFSALRRDQPRRLAFEARIRHLASFIRTRRAAWKANARISPMSELVRFGRGWVSAHMSRIDESRPSVPLSQRLPPYALAAVLIGGSAFDIVTDQEHWPFSQYPMFSAVETSRTFESLRLFGVPASGGPEIALLDYHYLEPLDQCRLSTALSWMSKEADAPERLRDVVGTIYARYEDRRTSAHHAGPRLRGIRLYRCRWRLDDRASNADHPDTRQLLLELAPHVAVEGTRALR
jgi:glucosyl-dolichyl phosphate glucuronosyltransferase